MRAQQQPLTQTFAFSGGMDLVTPAVLLPPGKVIAGSNYEPRAEGYRRLQGVERLDGHPAPSLASYSYITFNTGTVAIAVGNTVTGATSGATGVLLVAPVVQSGSYGGGNAAGYLVLTTVSGTFQSGENLQVGGVTKAHAASVATDRGAPDDTNDATWLAAAVALARSAIQAVPGGGAIRGVWYFGGAYYAWRDDAAVAPTKTRMYKATTAGWVLQSLGYSLPFTAGQAAGIAVGNTITGATSSATAVVSRILITSGAFSTNDAAGRMMLSTVTGNFIGENVTVGGTTRATIAAAPTANVITAGGRFECGNYNFYGATSLGAMYAVYGTGPGFEWDGTIFTPFLTGASDERPIHLAFHKQHLFLAYRNGSLQGSQSGLPQGWNGSLGATVFGIGNDITGLMQEVAGVLVVFSKSAINVLSGSISTDFAMSPLTNDSGALEWTVQTINGPTFMDQGGVRNLTTSQAFGDFKVGALSLLIQPLLDAKAKAGITVVGTMRVRAKAHYRVYFSDGTGFSIYVGGKTPSILPFDYGTRIPTVLASTIDANSNEILLMGCADGYVYQIDRGTSFDGDTINAFLRLPFNHCGTPNNNKRFQKMMLQVANLSSLSSLTFTAAFSDGDPDQPSVNEQSFSVQGGGGFWDESNWNQFYWSSRVLGKAMADIDGIGNNMAPTFGTAANDQEPHTLTSVTLTYSMRGPVKA